MLLTSLWMTSKQTSTKLHKKYSKEPITRRLESLVGVACVKLVAWKPKMHLYVTLDYVKADTNQTRWKYSEELITLRLEISWESHAMQIPTKV